MRSGTRMRQFGVWGGIAACIVLSGAARTFAVVTLPLYSFENASEFRVGTSGPGWGPSGFSGSDFISIEQSTLGTTLGSHSMAVETGKAIPPDTTGASWDVNVTVNPLDTTGVYTAFNTVSAELARYVLEFDVTFTPDSFAQVSSTGPVFQLRAAVNSSNPSAPNNFNQVLDLFGNLMGADTMGNPVPPVGKYTASIPMTSLPVVSDASFYQLTLGSNKTNALFNNGPNGEGAVYYVDNIRFRQLPQLIPTTLFSWETPDNPTTASVNEQYEGWITGFQPGHTHSIVTEGATDGTHALQIDRTGLESGFTWGSQFVISSDTNPDPEITEIDPVLQDRIDYLIDKISNGDRIAFDMTATYNGDPFPAPEPINTNFAVHFTDQTGVFYQKAAPNVKISLFEVGVPTTTTFEIPLSEFVSPGSGKQLKVDGFVDGSTFFRIGISSSTDGGWVYQIDNFRVLTAESEGLPGDYNEDGVVDAADYTRWRDNLGANIALPNEGASTGVVDQQDYDFWKLHFGEGAPGAGGGSLSAVPEPATAWFLMPLAAIVWGCWRRGNVRA
jgi:hypothetical protein